MEAILFILTALTALVSSFLVVTGKKPVNSVLFLVVTFFCIAVFYVLLGAQFIAAMQIIVYAGAIMVLFLFVVMLLNMKGEQVWERLDYSRKALAFVVASGVLSVAIVGIKVVALPTLANIETTGTVEAFADNLFSRWLLPFEMISILLLTAIIGSVMMVKRQQGDSK
jgi:NADH-quinone oxidoreductase subunit J